MKRNLLTKENNGRRKGEDNSDKRGSCDTPEGNGNSDKGLTGQDSRGVVARQC
jgi:hypothetical protein